MRAGPSSGGSSGSLAASALRLSLSMRAVPWPTSSLSGDKTFVSKPSSSSAVSASGLPLVYDQALIEAYWRAHKSVVSARWQQFIAITLPFFSALLAALTAGGVAELSRRAAPLARQARVAMEKLGPTFVKIGQMLSVRPDLLPQEALRELAALQAGVKGFDTHVAMQVLQDELMHGSGEQLGNVFMEISESPVAAASLAQVYKARLRSGEWVAVKVQRPEVLEMVSRDLYVLRKATEVYQGIMERFAPKQKTDYVALLNEWATGFYTELDFENEAESQRRLKTVLEERNVDGVYVPKVYREYSTRRVLVTEWVDGCKLSDCTKEEIRGVIGLGQECFLIQLLQEGFFHADPHPGNLIYMADETKGKIALLDFGLVASLEQTDIDQIVSSIIHLANKDYSSLVDDFISLGILPSSCDRSTIIPLMDKALSPYVRGGGAKKYEKELRRLYGMDGTTRGSVGGFQAMTQDALTVLNDVPFSIPPYFALVARAVVTLEGIALQADPDYSLIMEAYPFVARKLLREDRPAVQKALQETLYGGEGFSADRLLTLLNGALGVVSKTRGGVFIDLDSIPEDGVTLTTALTFILSDRARSLRRLLLDELESVGDVLLRQALRKTRDAMITRTGRLPGVGNLLDRVHNAQGPLVTPAGRVLWTSPRDLLDLLAPKLSRTEELYALSVVDAVSKGLDENLAALLAGDALAHPDAVLMIARALVDGQRDAHTDLVQQASGWMREGERKAEGEKTGLQELIAAVSALEERERDVLEKEASVLVQRLVQKFRERVEAVGT